MSRNNRDSLHLKSTPYVNKVEEIERKNIFYKDNPEKHPRYALEWKTFWEKRYAEVKRQGGDPEKYDYTKEWIPYWIDYAKKCYERELADLKEQSRRQSSSYSPQRSRRRRSRSSRSYSTISSRSSSRSSSSSYVRSKRQKRLQEKPRRKSPAKPAAFASTSSDSDDVQCLSPPVASATESISIVSVLRTLSALDSELGLLAHKVIDLLAQSLRMEKLEANSSERLMSKENIIFLETVKEKLKGLIATSLLPVKKIAAAKKCIQLIAQLIHESAKRGIRKEENNSKVIDSARSEIEIEKLKIAEMIARELEAQGKIDYTYEELEIIVEIFLDDLVKKDGDAAGANPYETFSDAELKLLIKNFTNLSEDEQQHLIKFLTIMERNEPERVQKLQSALDLVMEKKKPETQTDANANVITIDDDEEDYNFDELILQIK